jgi:hypothetical protein
LKKGSGAEIASCCGKFYLLMASFITFNEENRDLSQEEVSKTKDFSFQKKYI